MRSRLYALYVALLTIAVYVAPMAVSASRALATNAAWATLTSLRAPVAVAIDALLLALLRLGPVVGAVRPRAGEVTFEVAGPRDRARVLLGHWARTLAALTGVGLLLGGVLAGARPGAVGVAALVASTAVGVTAAALWLRGQAGARWSAPLVVFLLVAVAGTWWPPALAVAGPGGWWALSVSGPWPGLAAAVAAATALVTAWSAPSLRRLRAHDLMAHAGRVAGVAAGVARGSTAAMSDALTSTVSRGRALRLAAAPSGPPIVRRDLLGLRRAPETTLTGIALLGGSGWLAAAVVTHGWPLLVGTLAAALAHVGLHLLSGGLHAHAVAARRDAWLGVSFRQAAVQHGWVPFAAGVLTWWLAAAAGGVALVVWAPLVVLVLSCASMTATHQGDLPAAWAAFGTFDPTCGDTSVYARVMWFVGAPLLGVGASGGVLALAGPHPIAALALGLLALAVLSALASAAIERAGS